MSQLTHTIGEFVRIYWNKNKYVKGFIDDVTDNFTEKQLGEDLLKIVKSKAFKACIICGLFGLLPFVGGFFATIFSFYFTWSMYLAINKKVGITLSGNLGKTVVSGVITNLIGCYIGVIIVDIVFVPIFIIEKLLLFAICYVLIIFSAILYMKILTNFFANEEDKNNNQNNNTKEYTTKTENSEISKQQK